MIRRRAGGTRPAGAAQAWIVVGSVAVVLAVAAGVGVAVWRGGGDGGGAGASTTRRTGSTASPTTTVVVARAPLTGLPDPSGVTQQRAALSVKIENTPDARPQSGLDVADVVYEEVVEGGITRFWAIFHTTAPVNIGPIRSVRQMDPGIVSPIGGVIAYSGGAPANEALIRETPTVRVSEANAGDAFFRESTRYAPHNLYGVSAKLWERGGVPAPPEPLFRYLDDGEDARGELIEQFRVGFQRGYDPTYTFDDASGTWKRSYGSVPFMDASGNQVAPNNVVVQFISYPRDAEGELVGEGDAWVFAGDRLIRGRWSKPELASPTILVDGSNAQIELVPGRTWVELVEVGSEVDLIAVPAPTTTPKPTTATGAAPTTRIAQR